MMKGPGASGGGQGRCSRIFLVTCHLSLVTTLMLSTGCIHRNLTIRSEPPGATLYVNDRLLGTTPYSYDFIWYGGYRIMLKKEGFEQLDAHATLQAPWYFWLPLDLAMELLPVPVRDERELSYQLQPKPAPPSPTPPVTVGASEKTRPPSTTKEPQ